MASDELKLEIMTVRVPQGTLDRVDKVLKGGELRSVLIRRAVLTELVKREKAVQRRNNGTPRARELAVA